MPWHLKRRTIGIVALIAALFCAMTACVKEHSDVSPKQPDKVLFEHALSAVEHSRFDVAHITLQTLVNTYPNSKYATRAKRLLRDPRIASCGDGWTTSPDCATAEPAWPN
jgi:outer membrane protein assembly factor BamD (BamD/ComL family)